MIKINYDKAVEANKIAEENKYKRGRSTMLIQKDSEIQRLKCERVNLLKQISDLHEEIQIIKKKENVRYLSGSNNKIFKKIKHI